MTVARKAVLLSLLCLCSSAHGESWSELSMLQFYPAAVPDQAPSAAAAARPTAGEGSASGAQPMRAGHPPEEALAAISHKLDAIAEELATNGDRSPVLLEAYTSLASLYEAIGANAAARDALERAVAVSRVRNGIYSLAQADLIERMLADTPELKDANEANSLEDRLLELAGRNPGRPRTAWLFEALGEHELGRVRRLITQGLPPDTRISFGTTHIPSPDRAIQAARIDRLPPSVDEVAIASLHKARHFYERAMQAAIEIGGYKAPDLLAFEGKILRTYDLEISNPALAPHRGHVGGSFGPSRGLCEVGETAHEIHAQNVAKLDPTAAAEGAALVALADWRLLCAENGFALETYRKAYEALRASGAPDNALAKLFSPAVPARLPVFSAAEEAQPDDGGRGYIDVAFVIRQFGNANRLHVLETSPGTSKAVEERLKTYIRRSRFRPPLSAGQALRSAPVKVRYYYDYPSDEASARKRTDSENLAQ